MATNNSWFDENYYLNSKLVELQATGQTQYTTTVQVYDAIVAAGYTPLTHFQTFSLSEGTSPCQFFNTQEYLEAKANQLNATQGVTTWTASSVAVAFANAGYTNAYDHYAQWGWKEGVNPSNAFDNNAYIATNAAEAGLTIAEVVAAYVRLGVNPITQYETWGQGLGYPVTPVPADEQVTPAVDGLTYTLTVHADNYSGTIFNDTFNAMLGGANVDVNTLQSFDRLNGDAGVDTLNVELASVPGITTPASLANIEIINVQGVSTADPDTGRTLNLINAPQVTAVNNQNSDAVVNVTAIAEGATLSLSNTDVNAGFAFVRGADSDVNLTVSDVDGSTVTVENHSGTVNLTSTGQQLAENGVTLSDDSAATTVIVDGDLALNLVDNVATLVDATELTDSLTFILARNGGTVLGGSADDTLGALVNDAVIYGNAGDDIIGVIGDNAEVHGNEGVDAIDVDGDNADVHGNEGNDIIVVAGEDAVVTGNEGDDDITIVGSVLGSNISGDEGDDVINVDTALINDTLADAIIIDGGTGSNTLTFDVKANGALIGGLFATVDNIQTVEVNLLGALARTQSLDASLVGGLETIDVSAQDADEVNILTVTNLAGTEQININRADSGLSLVVASDTAAAANVNLEAAAGSTKHITISQDTGSGIETLELAVNDQSYTDVEVTAVTPGEEFTTINITGGAAGEALEIGTHVNLVTATIDASALASDLTLTLGGANQTITGGSGDNTFNFGTNLTSFDTVDGGDGGANTVSYTTLTGINAAQLTNVQTLEVTVNDAAAVKSSSTFSGQNSSGIETIDITASKVTTTQNLSFTNLDAALSSVTLGSGTIGDLRVETKTGEDADVVVDFGAFDTKTSVSDVTINNGGELSLRGTAALVAALPGDNAVELGDLVTDASALTIATGYGADFRTGTIAADSALSLDLIADGNVPTKAGTENTLHVGTISAIAATDVTIDASLNTNVDAVAATLTALQNLTIEASNGSKVDTFTATVDHGGLTETDVEVQTVTLSTAGDTDVSSVRAVLTVETSGAHTAAINQVIIDNGGDASDITAKITVTGGTAASIGSIDITNDGVSVVPGNATVVANITLDSLDSSIDSLSATTVAGATTDVNITGNAHDTVIDVNGGAFAGAGDLNIDTADITALDLSSVDTSGMEGVLTITGNADLLAAVGTAYGETIDLGAGNGLSVVEGGGGSDIITLAATGVLVDAVVYSAQSDSTGLVYDYVNNFGDGLGADVIDLSGLPYPLTGGRYDETTAAAADVTFNDATDVTFTIATTANFFGDVNVAADYYAAKSVNDATGQAAVVFVDTNHNGNWDAAADMAIVLIGDYTVATGTVLTADNFDFGGVV